MPTFSSHGCEHSERMRAGFGEQPLPSLAAAVDDLLGGVKDAVGQAIVAQMQPQSLDRVELGRVGRQEHQAEVLGHARLAGSMPQPALSISTTPCAPGATSCDSSARNRVIATVSSRVITSATPGLRAGHTAPIENRGVAGVTQCKSRFARAAITGDATEASTSFGLGRAGRPRPPGAPIFCRCERPETKFARLCW
jgi:hypothetical protein